MKRGPKLVVIGAGSYFFGKPVIYNMMTSPILREGELVMVDTDPGVLEVMMNFARRVRAELKSPVKLSGCVKRREVLADADFVVLTFSYRNTYYRKRDVQTAAKYGVTMCSGDTIGPGGVFRALREIPEVLKVAADVRELAPEAWLINFINPTATIGIAMMRYASDIRSFALCDGNHLPRINAHYLKRAGVLPPEASDYKPVPEELMRRVSFKIAGVNHFTWLLDFTLDGRSIMDRVIERHRQMAADEYEGVVENEAKFRLRWNYAYELARVFGAVPTAASHTKEYVRYFQGYGVSPVTPEPILPFDAEKRAAEMDKDWSLTESYANGQKPIAEFIASGVPDHATDIIESMWGGLGKEFFINGPNQGAVTNLADDAFLELRRKINMNGFQALPVGPLPCGVLAMTRQVLDTHELTAEAAVSCDRGILLRALCCDPIIGNIGDARNIMNELLEIERPHLPEAWFK